MLCIEHTSESMMNNPLSHKNSKWNDEIHTISQHKNRIAHFSDAPKANDSFSSSPGAGGFSATELHQKTKTNGGKTLAEPNFQQGVSENMGTPHHSIFTGFSIIFDHPFWGIHYFWKHPTQVISETQKKNPSKSSHPGSHLQSFCRQNSRIPGTNFSIGGRLSVRGAQRMDLFYCEVTRIESRIRCAATLLEGQFVSLLSSENWTAFCWEECRSLPGFWYIARYTKSLGIKTVVNDWLAAFFAEIVGLKGYQTCSTLRFRHHLSPIRCCLQWSSPLDWKRWSQCVRPQVTMCQ